MSLGIRDVENLVQMLDRNAGFTRPSTQSTGFSNDEPEEQPFAVPSANGANSKPSASISLPSTVVDKTIGLPVPSQTREGIELRAAQNAEYSRPKPKGNAIWCQDEIPSTSGGTAAPVEKATTLSGGGNNGGKINPEYDVMYKQFMGTEDVYLGVDFTKTGSSAMCEGLVVKIQLPKVASVADIALDVEPYLLILTSKEYALRAPLPIKVLAKKAAAKWDPSKKQLLVTLTTDLSDREIKLM